MEIAHQHADGTRGHDQVDRVELQCSCQRVDVRIELGVDLVEDQRQVADKDVAHGDQEDDEEEAFEMKLLEEETKR